MASDGVGVFSGSGRDCPDDVLVGMLGVHGVGAGVCVALGDGLGAVMGVVGAGLVKLSGGLIGVTKSSSLS